MTELVPDATMRARFEADLPRVMRSYSEEAVDVPRWPESRGAYLQLSPLYSGDADAAAARGWPVERIDAAHLHLLVAARPVADRILHLARQVVAA
jgi:hypothetical protein